jgi:hypothetical protein
MADKFLEFSYGRMTAVQSRGVTPTDAEFDYGRLTPVFDFYVPPITVDSVSPNSGTYIGGTAITITGTNFTNGTITVQIGGVNCTSIVYVNATTITAVTPAGSPGAENLYVDIDGNNDTLSNGFTYLGPQITAISPSSGTFKGGTPITLTGTGYQDLTLVLTIDGVTCTDITYVNATTITATTPAGSVGAKDVFLSVDGNGSTSEDAYTYLKPRRLIILEEVRTALQNITTGNGYNFDITAAKIIREPEEERRYDIYSWPVLWIKSGEEEEIIPISNSGDRNLFRVSVHGLVASDTDLDRSGNASDEFEKLIKDIRESIMSYYANGSFSNFVIEVITEQVEASDFFGEGVKVIFNFIFDNSLTEI